MFTINESFCSLLGVGKWDSFLLVLVIDTHVILRLHCICYNKAGGINMR